MYVPHVDTDAPGVRVAPLVLVHQTLTLPVKVDPHKLTICVEHG